MKTYKVTYVLDRTLKEQEETVQAKDYTKAYLSVYLKLPRGAMVTGVIEIKSAEEVS